VLSGTAELQVSGPVMDAVKTQFPWARGALVVRIERGDAALKHLTSSLRTFALKSTVRA